MSKKSRNSNAIKRRNTEDYDGTLTQNKDRIAKNNIQSHGQTMEHYHARKGTLILTQRNPYPPEKHQF